MRKHYFKRRSPLHFIITDNSGHTVAVEPHNGLLIVKDNHVKVLTNALS